MSSTDGGDVIIIENFPTSITEKVCSINTGNTVLTKTVQTSKAEPKAVGLNCRSFSTGQSSGHHDTSK